MLKLIEIIRLLSDKAPTILPLILELIKIFSGDTPDRFGAAGASSESVRRASDVGPEPAEVEAAVAEGRKFGADPEIVRELAKRVAAAEQRQ